MSRLNLPFRIVRVPGSFTESQPLPDGKLLSPGRWEKDCCVLFGSSCKLQSMPFEKTELRQSVTTHVLAESLAIRLQRIHHFIKVVLILTGFVPG